MSRDECPLSQTWLEHTTSSGSYRQGELILHPSYSWQNMASMVVTDSLHGNSHQSSSKSIFFHCIITLGIVLGILSDPRAEFLLVLGRCAT